MIRNGEVTRIMTSHGEITLQPNVVHWLPREDAEPLIRDGVADEMGDRDLFAPS